MADIVGWFTEPLEFEFMQRAMLAVALVGVLGAVVAAVATALGIAFISQRGRLRFDTAIGVLFVGAFALGIVIVSRQENYTVDLFSFVFGNVLGVSWNDLSLMAALGVAVIALVPLFFK